MRGGRAGRVQAAAAEQLCRQGADTTCQPVPCCCATHSCTLDMFVAAVTDGPAGGSIEAVLIPMLHRRGTRRHITLCVSSQVRRLLQSSTTNSHAAEKEPAVCVC